MPKPRIFESCISDTMTVPGIGDSESNSTVGLPFCFVPLNSSTLPGGSWAPVAALALIAEPSPTSASSHAASAPASDWPVMSAGSHWARPLVS